MTVTMRPVAPSLIVFSSGWVASMFAAAALSGQTPVPQTDVTIANVAR